MTQGTNFIIEDMATDGKITVGSLSCMNLEDAKKAIEIYDSMRLNRNRPRKARLAKTQDDLALAYYLKRISRSTYYRRLKELGLSPAPPKWSE